MFHCPLKPDAISTIRELNDSSHRCVMITGDNPLTAAHVAKQVEIVDREVLILDHREGSEDEAGMCFVPSFDCTDGTDLTWRTADESIVISVNPQDPIDTSLFDTYDICMTGAALRQYASLPAWTVLVQNTWVYARVSPSQKEFILTTLKSLGYVTLMAGDGTNDVGALKQANIGVALLNGTEDDLKAILEFQKKDRTKKMYEQQLKFSARFGQPPPPVPALIADLFPDAVAAQKEAALKMGVERSQGVVSKVRALYSRAGAEQDAVRCVGHHGAAVEPRGRVGGAADQVGRRLCCGAVHVQAFERRSQYVLSGSTATHADLLQS